MTDSTSAQFSGEAVNEHLGKFNLQVTQSLDAYRKTAVTLIEGEKVAPVAATLAACLLAVEIIAVTVGDQDGSLEDMNSLLGSLRNDMGSHLADVMNQRQAAARALIEEPVNA